MNGSKAKQSKQRDDCREGQQQTALLWALEQDLEGVQGPAACIVEGLEIVELAFGALLEPDPFQLAF